MAIQSLIIGLLFGVIWGSLFTSKFKQHQKTPLQSSSLRASAWFLASTSIIRYLLLAALLTVLMVKYNLSLAWWSIGFLVSFWVMLIQKATPFVRCEQLKATKSEASTSYDPDKNEIRSENL